MNRNMLNKKEDIIDWLEQHQIRKYSLVEDDIYGYVINTQCEVDVYNQNLSYIPVKFNNIHGYFDCSGNQLKSLEFSPKYVKRGFYCSGNILESLIGGPQFIDGSFDCNDNQLTSLEGCPVRVHGSFSCKYNDIAHLEFCPSTVNKHFFCDENIKLGDLQQEIDFRKIYEAHRAHLQIKLHKELNQKLEIIPVLPDGLRKNKKI